MKDAYKELKNKDYDLYIKTIEKAGSIALRNNLSLNESYNLESSLVEFVLLIIK